MRVVPKTGRTVLTAFALCLAAAGANAEVSPHHHGSAKYTIDPDHTYPSFEADHMGGLSSWRGKFNATSGSIVLDKHAQTGALEIVVDMGSIDFGHEKMNEHAKSPDMFDVAKFPTATYKGQLTKFVNGAPTQVEGQLTMHGVTKPVTLTIDRFLCKQHPMRQKEVCGANAYGRLDRDEFGVSYGKAFGFDTDVKLQIQVEALREG